MTNDNAVVKLLYAILSQKCLKDIDWNKVAAHSVLNGDITNGHAARMRYSRFKKQIDGAPAVRKPRNTNSPRKKAEKKPKKEKVKAQDNNGEEKIKEEVGVAGSSHHTPAPGTPGADFQPGSFEGSFHGSLENSYFIKREPGSSNVSLYATTPLEESTTPASSFHGGAEDMSDADEMYTSFHMPGPDYMPEPMMSQAMMGQQQYEMGMHMMGDSYPVMWEPQHLQTEGGMLVKREARWEPSYDQV